MWPEAYSEEFVDHVHDQILETVAKVTLTHQLPRDVYALVTIFDGERNAVFTAQVGLDPDSHGDGWQQAHVVGKAAVLRDTIPVGEHIEVFRRDVDAPIICDIRLKCKNRWLSLSV